MPIPLAVGLAGASALGSGLNSIFGAFQNKFQRKENERIYNRQRADALADWSMMNEYNSPAKQMARFKEAGLNPALIYGQSNVAAPVRSSDYAKPSPQPITPGDIAQSAVGTYFDVKIKEQTLDNLKKQYEGMVADQALKGLNLNLFRDTFDARKNRIISDAEIADFTSGIRSSQSAILQNTAETTIQAEVQKLVNLRTQNMRNLAEVDRIRRMTQNLIKDGTLKQLDIDLKKLGVQPSDALWQRIIARILSSFGLSL